MYYKLAPLALTPGKNASTTSDVFIAQPDSIKEALAGKLFILVEIEGRKNENLKIINFLIDNINHNYYQNEKILLREKISTLKVEHIFEAALAKTNKNFSDFLSSERIKIDLRDINITAGIIYEDSIHFVNNGNNKAFLIYRALVEDKKKSAPTDKQYEYKISDIINQSGTNKNKKIDEKLFTNVVSGSIPRKGNFIFTNEALPEYISNNQLIKITTALPPTSAVEQIKNTLNKINSYVSFLGILIKSTTLEKTEKMPEITPTSTQASISNLNRTEDDTENLLAPSGIVNPKKWLKMPDFLADKIEANSNKNNKSFLIKDKIFVKKKAGFSFLNKAFIVLKNASSHVLNATIFVAKKATNRESLNAAKEKIKETTQANMAKVSRFNFNNKRNKILLTLSLIFILLFFVNLSMIKIKNKKAAVQAEYENLVAEIEQRQNKVESFLLYNNEDGAKELFGEIDDLLATFPQETSEQTEQYNEFLERDDLQKEKVRHVVRLQNLEEVANLANLTADAQGENLVFSASANKIYSADSQEKSIYILDLNDKSVTTATNLDTSINSLKFPALTKENVTYYLNDNSIVELTAEEKINNLNIDLVGTGADYTGADTYNDRLYLLDPANNEIYRYTRTGDAFGSGQAWTTEDIDFSNAVDISIDGHIYALKNNGEMIKMLKGQRQEMEMEAIDPPIKNATRLYVSEDLKFVYILEPSKNRLVIFDKTGKFLMQYTSDQFTDLKDFTVDETNKLLYFLNSNSILKAEATHLE